MKKAQTVGQVFIYIFTIIVFGIILLYGYRAIKNMGNRANQVLLIQLKKDMMNAIEKTDYGSIVKHEMTLPTKYHEVCFVDLSASANSALSYYQPLVYNSWKDKVNANMFLIQDRQTMEPHYIGEIGIDNPYYVCINATQGKVTVKLEGKGKYVRVSKWVP